MRPSARSLFSMMIGVFTVVGLLTAGGATMSGDGPRLVEVQLDLSSVSFPQDLPEPAEPPPGCRPPLEGATCLPPVTAGGLDVLVSVYELVPAEVDSVEDWRPLVAHFFRPGDVDRALRIIACESGGDPKARNPGSSATGLFQHLGRLWPERAARAGWGGYPATDPVANVAVAAWLVYEGGGWSHWAPSRGCWS